MDHTALIIFLGIIFLSLITLIVHSYYSSSKTALSFLSFEGIYFSSSGRDIFIKGNILSIIYNNSLIYGEPTFKNNSGNSISNGNQYYYAKIDSGHLTISGNIDSLTINEKLLSLNHK